MGDTPPDRPTPLASGTLEKTPLVHLLVYALEKRLVGTMQFTAPDERSGIILFANGQPVKAWTSEPVAYLGRVLLELGYLSEDELTRSLAELAAAKGIPHQPGQALHGRLLLASGAIEARELAAGLREQLARKLRYMGGLPPTTSFAYYEAFDALKGWGLDGAPGFDPLPMIWGVLRESRPRDHIDAALQRVMAAALHLAAGADPARLGLGAEQRTFVERLRNRAIPTAEMMESGALGGAEARLLVYLLLLTKMAEVVPRPVASGASPEVTTGAPAPRGTTSNSHAQRASPSSVLRNASEVASAPPPSEPKIAVASRGSGASASSVKRTVSVATPTTAKPPVPMADGPAGQASPSATLPAASRLRWEEIVERAATIDRADYFTMLELARDATTGEVEAAFLALAKKWHPDRLPAELAPVKDACGRVFSRMSEAHATLIDEGKRDEYMRLLADGSGSPEAQETVAKVVEAATNYQKAEVCLRRSDFVQAETLCRRALEADATQPDYVAMMAWLMALKPENQSQEKTRDSIKMLDRAISLSDKCERAYFWRGLLYKRMGRGDLAVKDFKRAVELNPRNIDAAREVRLYLMRGGRRSSDPPSATSSSSPPPKPPSLTPRGAVSPNRGSVAPKADEVKPGLLGRLFRKT
jgi:curved DNA-binding protein CbpA